MRLELATGKNAQGFPSMQVSQAASVVNCRAMV